MNTKNVYDVLFIQSLTELIDKLLDSKDTSYEYFMTAEQSSPTIINLSLYKKGGQKSSKRIRIYKLDFSKYRITIFKLDGFSTYREMIEQDVKRLNIITYNGKKLFVELFIKLFKYIKIKYLKGTNKALNEQLIDDNKDALDDISFINNIALKKL